MSEKDRIGIPLDKDDIFDFSFFPSKYDEELDFVIRAVNSHHALVEALGSIINDLPSNRDWLDPALEGFAKKALEEAKGE